MRIRSLMVIALGLAGCAPEARPAPAATTDDTTQAPAGLASPRDTARGTVGAATLLIDYGRPSRRGREIFGSLVPFDQVWRTGANAATTLVLGGPVQLGNTPIAAGTYTLYSLPARDGWTLIVNGQTRQWGTEYVKARDVARVPLTVTKVEPVDTFRIAIEDGAAEARLLLAWDTLQGSVPIRAQ